MTTAPLRIGKPPRAPRRYVLRVAAAVVLGTAVSTLVMITLAPLIDLFLLPVTPSEWVVRVILVVGLFSSLLTALATPRRPRRRSR